MSGKHAFFALLGISSFLALCGCDPSPEAVKVMLTIHVPSFLMSSDPAADTNIAQGESYTTRGVDGGISKIKVTVTGDDMSEQTEYSDVSIPSPITLTLFVVIGSARTFRVDALAADETTVVLTGSATADILKNQLNEISLILEPPTADVGIDAIIHEITGSPQIHFTFVPPYGSYDNVAGVVENCAPKDCKVIVMIQAWVGWWVKPYLSSPYTIVRSDGTWECDYTTGGVDNTAGEIRAYLVASDYVFSGMPDEINDPKVYDMDSVTRSP